VSRASRASCRRVLWLAPRAGAALTDREAVLHCRCCRDREAIGARGWGRASRSPQRGCAARRSSRADVGDQWAGDIVTVPGALFDGVARRHRVAVGVEQHAGEQAGVARSCAGVALGRVAGALGLSRIPQQLVNDRRVFAPQGARRPSDNEEGRF